MKKLTAGNYKEDKYYIAVVKAVTEILENQKYLTPISVFVTIGLLSNDNVARWKKGSIPYLERVIICNLSKASRILRLIRFHCHDLNMTPSISVYKGKNGFLRFSKTGEKNLEEAYSRHFVSNKKTALTNRGRCRIVKPLTDALPLPPITTSPDMRFVRSIYEYPFILSEVEGRSG